MKRSWSAGIAIVLMLSLASCDYQKYNTIRQKDPRYNDPYVYGPNKDSAAIQSKYKYTPNPALEGRTQKIREKLFGEGTIGEGA